MSYCTTIHYGNKHKTGAWIRNSQFHTCHSFTLILQILTPHVRYELSYFQAIAPWLISSLIR